MHSHVHAFIYFMLLLVFIKFFTLNKNIKIFIYNSIMQLKKYIIYKYVVTVQKAIAKNQIKL